ncbi:MAG: hypothetical protein IKN31_03885 [Bacteroidales bacterium]|nr:hypothetical protein [Bacteroidales bacterium]
MLIQTDDFEIYDISSDNAGPFNELIRLTAFPEASIYFSDTPITKGGIDYQNYASILMNGHYLMTICSSLEEVDGGYNVYYLIGDDEPFSVFVSDEDMEPHTKASGWGDRTAACIQDLYGSRGWLSVGYFVLTAFIPETVVIVATTCAVANYNQE